jgi:hypothetical protein
LRKIYGALNKLLTARKKIHEQVDEKRSSYANICLILITFKVKGTTGESKLAEHASQLQSDFFQQHVIKQGVRNNLQSVRDPHVKYWQKSGHALISIGTYIHLHCATYGHEEP